MFDVALFEYQWSIFLDSLPTTLLLYIAFWINFDLLDWHELFTFYLVVQSNRFTSLFRYSVIELTSLIFAREREVAGEDYLAEDVLTVGLLDSSLMLIGKALVHSLWLLGNQLINH